MSKFISPLRTSLSSSESTSGGLVPAPPPDSETSDGDESSTSNSLRRSCLTSNELIVSCFRNSSSQDSYRLVSKSVEENKSVVSSQRRDGAPTSCSGSDVSINLEKRCSRMRSTPISIASDNMFPSKRAILTSQAQNECSCESYDDGELIDDMFD